jgi:hypothetical protein
MHCRVLFLTVTVGLGIVGCAKEPEPFDPGQDGDSDTNSGNDEVTDAGDDSEKALDTGTGIDTERDAGTDSNADTDTGSGADTATATVMDTPTDTDTASATQAGSDGDTVATDGSDDDTAIEKNTDSAPDTATNSDAEPETDTPTHLDTGAGSDSDSGTGSDSESESETRAETCFDSEQNQDETGIDCGGETCAPCPCKHFEYSAPEQVSIEGITGNVYSPSLSEDGLTMYISRYQGFEADIWVAVRERRDSLHFEASRVTEIAASGANDRDGTPFLSADGLALYFQSERSGGMGGRDIMKATREDVSSAFQTPTFVTEVNSEAHEHQPWLSEDGLTFFFLSTRTAPEFSGDDDNIWYATRESLDAPFGDAQFLHGINTDAKEGRVALTKDLLTIYFDTNGRDSMGETDIFVATRKDLNSDFENIENLTDAFNSTDHDRDVTLTSDGTELYFSSERTGSARIWRSVRTCADTSSFGGRR